MLSTLEIEVYHRCLCMYKSLLQLLDDDRTFKIGADVHAYNTRCKNNLSQISSSSTTKGLLDWLVRLKLSSV